MLNKPKESSSSQMLQDFKNLKKLWPFLVPDKLMLLLSLLLIPLITLIQLFEPFVLKHAIDDGIMSAQPSNLVFYASIYLGMVLVEYLCRTTQSLTTSTLVQRMILRLRSQLCRHVMSLSASFHDQNMSGALTTRATSDFDNLSESLTQGVVESVVDIFVLLGCMGGMWLLSPKLALIIFIIVPLTGLIVLWFSSAIKVSMLKARVALAQLNAYTQECLYGLSTIKLLTAENESQSKFKDLSLKYRNSQMTSVGLDALLYSLLDGLAAITIGFTLWIILSYFHLDEGGGLSAGIVVAFVRYIQQTFDPLKQLGQTIAMMQGVFTGIDRIFGLLETQSFIAGHLKPTHIQGHIRFSDVSFHYQVSKKSENPHLALDAMSFEIPAKSSLALVGPTGGGKSTIIKLLTKLYDGYSGSITLDGMEMRDLDPHVLRESISIVPQDIVIFRATIAFNIGLDLVSREAIVEAAKLVGIHDFIMSLPQNYESLILDRGENLSLGQKQLLIFARALARKPSLVILDEATSAIDTQSEKIIEQAIAKIFSQTSVIVVAHRLSTIQHCDHILAIEKGKVVESGSHKELLKIKGLYHKLYHHDLV